VVLIAKRRLTMFKNKKLAAALLVTTFVAASATTALAPSAGAPSQIPGYDRHGGTVPIPNPDRS
jgi:hypothetical protein